MADFLFVLRSDHCNRPDGNYPDFKEHSLKKGCLCRFKVGRYPNRPYRSVGCCIGFWVYQCGRGAGLYPDRFGGVWKDYPFWDHLWIHLCACVGLCHQKGFYSALFAERGFPVNSTIGVCGIGPVCARIGTIGRCGHGYGYGQYELAEPKRIALF